MNLFVIIIIHNVSILQEISHVVTVEYYKMLYDLNKILRQEKEKYLLKSSLIFAFIFLYDFKIIFAAYISPIWIIINASKFCLIDFFR